MREVHSGAFPGPALAAYTTIVEIISMVGESGR
jgi:hypothetical protein